MRGRAYELVSFKYLVKQGWLKMVANRLMTVASLGVLTACLVITGIAGILSVSVSNICKAWAIRT